MDSGSRFSANELNKPSKYRTQLEKYRSHKWHFNRDEHFIITKMLRLEVSAARTQAIMTQENCTNFTGLSASIPARFKELENAIENPELVNAMK